MENTGEMCMVQVFDANQKDGFRMIDIGNYWIDSKGKRCVFTSKKMAERYSHLIDVPIYVKKGSDGNI